MRDIETLSAALADRYAIERELGAGGMATVYLARDLKHDRAVAIKVLKPELAAMLGADRFIFEIKTTAALQHPNILPLFDSGAADGFLYYVRPFVDGETLRAKLDRESQLPVDDAVRIACDIASALQYAHQHGVIHRDIKPENILLHDGRPMVADFGIALAVSAAAGSRITETGLSLGTPQYMSPEQATADKVITARSDVYSLASVLYETLAGQPPHLGGSAQQIMMKLIAAPVEAVTRHRSSVPMNVTAALAKALEKLPADRFDSAKAFADALMNSSFASAGAAGAVATPRDTAVSRRMRFVVAAGVVASILSAFAVGRTLGRDTLGVSEEPRFWSIALPDSAPFVPGVDQYAIAWRSLDISADGREVAYGASVAGVAQLMMARTDAGTVTAIANTTDGLAPLFAPDGRTLFFATSTDIRRLSLADGISARVTAIPDQFESFTWGGDDRLFVNEAVACLQSVPATGGQLRPSPKSLCHAGTLAVIPERPNVLVASLDIGIALSDAATGAFQLVHGVEPAGEDSLSNVVFGRNALVVGARYLIFVRDSTLLVAPIDLNRARLTSPPVPILSGVRTEAGSGTAQIAVSLSGAAVWVNGGDANRARFVWVGRDGRVLDTLPIHSDYVTSFALSTDGNRVAYSTPSNGGRTTIHVADLSRRVVDSATFEGLLRPWQWMQGNQAIPLQRALDAPSDSGQDSRRTLRVSTSSLSLDSAHTDVTAESTDGSARCASNKLWFGRNTQDSVLTSLKLSHCALSADGRMIAWRDGLAVYLSPVRADFERLRIKIGDGGMDEPLFSRDGREVVMRNGNAWYSVAVPANGAALQPPRLLFTGSFNNVAGASWALAPDGRLLLLLGPPPTRARHLNVITNFPRYIEEKLKTAK